MNQFRPSYIRQIWKGKECYRKFHTYLPIKIIDFMKEHYEYDVKLFFNHKPKKPFLTHLPEDCNKTSAVAPRLSDTISQDIMNQALILFLFPDRSRTNRVKEFTTTTRNQKNDTPASAGAVTNTRHHHSLMKQPLILISKTYIRQTNPLMISYRL